MLIRDSFQPDPQMPLCGSQALTNISGRTAKVVKRKRIELSLLAFT
jgi:hypothetical protein